MANQMVGIIKNTFFNRVILESVQSICVFKFEVYLCDLVSVPQKVINISEHFSKTFYYSASKI